MSRSNLIEHCFVIHDRTDCHGIFLIHEKPAASPLSPSVRLKPTGFQSFTTDSDADCAETGWQLKNRSKRELLFRSHRFCIESSVMVNRVISVFVVFSLAWKLMIMLSSCCFQSRFAFAWNHAIRSAQCQHSISSFPEISVHKNGISGLSKAPSISHLLSSFSSFVVFLPGPACGRTSVPSFGPVIHMRPSRRIRNTVIPRSSLRDRSRHLHDIEPHNFYCWCSCFAIASVDVHRVSECQFEL